VRVSVCIVCVCERESACKCVYGCRLVACHGIDNCCRQSLFSHCFGHHPVAMSSCLEPIQLAYSNCPPLIVIASYLYNIGISSTKSLTEVDKRNLVIVVQFEV
jgi:hypothetical protein